MSETVPPLRSGGLMLSYRCDNACRHCLYRCGPHRPDEWIDETTLETVFATLSRERQLSGIHLAGGEATLNMPLLVKALELAGEYGVPIDYLETNARWCDSLAAGRERFARLHAAGLRAVLISASLFHNEFVPVRHTLHAIEAAQEVFGGGVIVWTPDVLRLLLQLPGDGTHALAEACAHLGIDGDGGELWRVHAYLTPGGRAAQALAAGLTRYPAERFAGQACGSELRATGHFHIDPQGNLFTGLCPGIAPATIEDPHPDLTAANAPIFAALCAAGPAGLVARAREEAGFVPQAEGYIGKCHLCLDVRAALQATGRYDELRPALYYT